MQVNIRIAGQVQGVFFRRSAKEEADRLAIGGWVRNNRDGSVEIMAVGPKDQLDQFAAWCKKGPREAKVEKVDIKWEQNSKDFDKFEII